MSFPTSFHDPSPARRHRRRTPLLAMLLVALGMLNAQTAHASGGYPDGATGYDISWPQCGGPYPPQGSQVAIVGLIDGHPYDYYAGGYSSATFRPNPCLVSEWAWAKTSPSPPSVYLVIDSPSHVNRAADPYDYGRQTAVDSVAYARSHSISPAFWWLDVETSDCWSTNCPTSPDQFDRAAAQRVIQGNLDYLRSQNLMVGVYSTSYQWNLITGGYTPPGGVPVWAADYNDPQSQAYLGCTSSYAFAGGEVSLVQTAPGQFDPDYSCPSHHGYWLVAADGGVFPFGTAGGYGSTGNIRLNQPIVGLEGSRSSQGYWMVAADGGIFPFGDATRHSYGSTGNISLNRPVVGMARTMSGDGYWIVASDGGIFPFGDAVGYGSTGNIALTRPVVGMARTASGKGYYLVASDGGIFPFGDAVGYGSTGNIQLNQPIVGMVVTPSGNGYWLVAADGGIFPFGDALFHSYGSAGNRRLDGPVVGMAPTSDGGGYWMVTARGTVIPFGDALSQAYGDVRNVALARPVLGISASG